MKKEIIITIIDEENPKWHGIRHSENISCKDIMEIVPFLLYSFVDEIKDVKDKSGIADAAIIEVRERLQILVNNIKIVP
jgi:hypothetical protein